MREIGGFISPKGRQLENLESQHILALNTARNAIEYILRLENPSAVWLPKWCCDAVYEPVLKLHIHIKWYSVDDNLEPLDISPVSGEVLLIINYYGKIDYQKQRCLKEKYDKAIIIFDNSQAFYTKHIEGCYCIYSCRKFFPVTDGAFLYTEKFSEESLPQDFSYPRIAFLYKRLECGANDAYGDFVQNEELLSNQEIRAMSLTTQTLLKAQNITQCAVIRTQNFKMLHKELCTRNQFSFDASYYAPLCYPLFIPGEGEKLKKLLIENNIYIPTYWNDARKRLNKGELEHSFIKDIVPLPLDQRYEKDDMDWMLGILKKGGFDFG